MVTQRNALISSKQVSSRFLCGECEERFHSNGENYIATQYALSDGQFKLRQLLQAASPLYSDSKSRIYDVQPLLDNKVDQYLYFAASVFWRASAHSWTTGHETVSQQVSLGPEYQEQFRLYLLGKAAFPQDARIWVCVSSEAPADSMAIVFPYGSQNNGLHRYQFYIRGLLFILFLGKDIPQQFDHKALNGSKQQLMWLRSWQEESQ